MTNHASPRKSGYVLPRTLVPQEDESLPGLILRTAAEYRFHDPMRLFNRIRPPKALVWTFSQLPPDSEVGNKTRQALNLCEASHRRMSLWNAKEFHNSIRGHAVWASLVRNNARAYCPLCLRESAYHRSSWLVSPFTLCAKHTVPIRDRCHRCKRLLSWTGMGVQRCSIRGCGADLRDAPPGKAEPQNVKGIAALVRLIEDDGAEAPFGMPPGEAIRLSFLFGQSALGFEQGKRIARPPGFIEREQARVAALMQAGWNVLSDWPTNFHALLDELRGRAAGRSGKHGLVKAFGKMSLLVHDLAREPWGGPFGTAFADYAASLPELRTSTRQLERYAPGQDIQDDHVSLSEAMRRLDMSPAPMMALAERRGLYVVRPVGGGAPSKLRVDDVAKLQTELEDSISSSGARAMLGVGAKVMSQLETAGLVRRAPAAECVMALRPFRRSEIERFVSSCVGTPRRLTSKQATQAGLTSLTRASVLRPVTDICKALVEGRLKPAARVDEAVGLMQVRLRMRDVGIAVPSTSPTVSMNEGAEMLGAMTSAVVTWLRRGLLERVSASGRGERGTRVEVDAVERFRTEYAFGRDLGALFGQEANFQLSRHLRFVGVEPVSAKDIDGSVTALFRRSDITPEVIAAVSRLQLGRPETAQDKHRASFARVAHVARVVGSMWKADFKRMHSTFSDQSSSRTLHVVCGRRPDLKGIFRFTLRPDAVMRLKSLPDAWVALVPDVGNTFVLVPNARLRWDSRKSGEAYLSLHFEKDGRARGVDGVVVPLGVEPGAAESMSEQGRLEPP